MDINGLVAEYRSILACAGDGLPASRRIDSGRMVALLHEKAGWTTEGAHEIVRIVREYGGFILKNALALAIVLGVQDGEKGL